MLLISLPESLDPKKTSAVLIQEYNITNCDSNKPILFSFGATHSLIMCAFETNSRTASLTQFIPNTLALNELNLLIQPLINAYNNNHYSKTTNKPNIELYFANSQQNQEKISSIDHIFCNIHQQFLDLCNIQIKKIFHTDQLMIDTKNAKVYNSFDLSKVEKINDKKFNSSIIKLISNSYYQSSKNSLVHSGENLLLEKNQNNKIINENKPNTKITDITQKEITQQKQISC